MAVTLLLAGCHIPANSPLSGLAQVRPLATPHTNVLPPTSMLQHPGPGVEGPGPGIITPDSYTAALAANGVMVDGNVLPAGGYDESSGVMPGELGAACPPDGVGSGMGIAGAGSAQAPASQVGFIGPDGMQVRWDVSLAGGFDSEPLVTPGRYDFPQGGIYRLKLTDIPGY